MLMIKRLQTLTFTVAIALSAADLVTTLQGPGLFTVFAPINAAFAKIPAAVLGAIVRAPALLSQVLLYHVGAGRAHFRRADEPRVVSTVQGERFLRGLPVTRALQHCASITRRSSSSRSSSTTVSST